MLALWLPVSTTSRKNGLPPAMSASRRRGRFIPELECRLLSANTRAAQIGKLPDGGIVANHDEGTMRCIPAARRVIGRYAEQSMLAAIDCLQRVAAGLREQHFGADPGWNRRPREFQFGRQTGQTFRGERVRQDGPERPVGRLHFRQIVHRQAGGQRGRHKAGPACPVNSTAKLASQWPHKASSQTFRHAEH